jgi:methyl-accepting chemotaxis protein WspA
MNKTTVWRRLNTAQLILIGLLLVGVGVALWMQQVRSDADQRRYQIGAGSSRIRFNLSQMTSTLRGLLIDPRTVIDRTTSGEGKKELNELTKKDLSDLVDTSEKLQTEFASTPEIVQQLRAILDFARGPLDQFYRTTGEILKTNVPAATTFYVENLPPLHEQREKLISQLLKQADNVTDHESAHAQKVSTACLAVIVLVFVAVFIVGRFQSTAVSKPLGNLIDALERMRRGDFSQRITMQRDDEFGVLSENLNRLAEDLSGLVGQVQRSGIQVNTTATEIAATAREQQSTANQIAATTAEIGATSKEISATSKELDKTMNEVSQVAEDTAQLANSGQTGIGRMESTMRQIMDASGAITAKLAVLSEKTANINTVVTTITKVADQTNLLSLNAAIEAEKAGEYGLGFAVVAMEIRRLADQTAVATYDIEKMVKEMQSAVSAGVMGMDKFSEEVRRGVDEIRQVSTQLAQIIHQVQTLTPRFQTVNEGMHAQATGAQQISETLIQLSEAAQQTAESLRHSNLAIEQLNEAARGLQTSVSRFKLEAS